MERSDRALGVPAATAAPSGAFTTLSLNRPDYCSHLLTDSLTDSPHAGVKKRKRKEKDEGDAVSLCSFDFKTLQYRLQYMSSSVLVVQL
ncbi:hypothetical protein INR49_000214 [Caranx melampygus]|nr:hypothetical protein INR49_000214 [Caranx melampygus]